MTARELGMLTAPGLLSLDEAIDPDSLGGKAVALGVAVRAGLPVPGGIAVSAGVVAAVVGGDCQARARIAEAAAGLRFPLAVRSSAVGEDGADASFAGQHLSVLNVCDATAAIEAVAAVGASAGSAAALGYRRRMGADAAPRCGVVLQRLVVAEVAGVLFTCNPVTGADERVIEASWSLGEAVVSGLVIPDTYRLGRDGTLLQLVVGRKDTVVVPAPGGGTHTRVVDQVMAARQCLGVDELAQLNDLADACERVYGGTQDIEWAFAESTLALLQRRPVTA